MNMMERKYLIKFMYLVLRYIAKQPVKEEAAKLAEAVRIVFKEEVND